MKIIVYPGSFDPLHNGHLLIARTAKASVKADKVLFLLSPGTVWKKIDTSFDHRAKMLTTALQNEEGFEISLIEAENEGKTNYTFLTLERLKTLYPQDDLFLLIGADQAEVFEKWNNPEGITALAKLLVYKRHGSKINKTNINRFQMEVVAGPLNNTSSSAVRRFESIDVPSSVLEYIGSEKLYFTAWISKKISDKRYYHSFEVAKLSRLIALANGLDPFIAFTAGFLHDIAKDIPVNKQRLLMEEHYPKYLDLPPWSYHQFIGEHIARTEFDIKDRRILQAIKYHATGKKKMKPYDKIVFAADKVEPTRGFDSSELIAALVSNLDKGFKIVVAANREYLKMSKKDDDNRLTNALYKTYLKD